MDSKQKSGLPNYSEMTNFLETPTDFGYQSYVGWEHSSRWNENLKYLYSIENLSNLQKIITKSSKYLI